MSRGPGKQQRLILAELAKRDCFYLIELLPENYRKSEYNALNRAACTLADSGQITFWRYICGTDGHIAPGGQAKLLCARYGTQLPEKRPKLSVGRVKNLRRSNT